MLESQGGTVIDQPQLAVRPQEIRILNRPIWVLNQAVEPHNGRRELVIDPRLRDAVGAARTAESTSPSSPSLLAAGVTGAVAVRDADIVRLRRRLDLSTARVRAEEGG